MKKLILSSLVLFTALFSKAQSGNNQISVAAEVGIPTGDFAEGFNTGFGGSVKGLYGVGNSGQITFTTGYTTYKAKGNTSDYSASFNIIPFLAGFRLLMNGFYIEPQAGYGIYAASVKIMGEKASSSEGAFTYAGGIGYANNKIDIGVRYQGATQDGDSFGLIGIHLGYNFSASPANKK